MFFKQTNGLFFNLWTHVNMVNYQRKKPLEIQDFKPEVTRVPLLAFSYIFKSKLIFR